MFPHKLSHSLAVGSTAAILSSGLLSATAQADYTVRIHKDENRGVWEGWGCSLAWWAHAVGGKNYQDLYADLFFSSKTVPFLEKELPGLNMNIARYNIGGGGNHALASQTGEKLSEHLVWYKNIEGYWLDRRNSNPQSTAWDWNRDTNQRQFLKAIQQRGANKIEFFSNAPMWWMNTSKSSAGGRLEAAHNRDFARYVATVVDHAQKNWGVKPDYIVPFNEPSEGWWTYPKNQEGCTIPRRQQAEILGYLREELDKLGLSELPITASDENTMNRGRETNSYFQTRHVQVRSQFPPAASLIEKINVHAYGGNAPWRDNAARTAMHKNANGKRLWMSEYGDGEPTGIALAQTIVEDINYLRPTAWVYWQPLEQTGSRWGLVNAHFADKADDPESGKPTRCYNKYYVLAQFSRFLRPGHVVLGSSDNNSVIAYDAGKRQLILLTVNYAHPQTIEYDLSNFKQVGHSGNVTVTETKGEQLFQTSPLTLQDKRFSLRTAANSIYSVVIDGVDL